MNRADQFLAMGNAGKSHCNCTAHECCNRQIFFYFVLQYNSLLGLGSQQSRATCSAAVPVLSVGVNEKVIDSWGQSVARYHEQIHSMNMASVGAVATHSTHPSNGPIHPGAVTESGHPSGHPSYHPGHPGYAHPMSAAMTG